MLLESTCENVVFREIMPTINSTSSVTDDASAHRSNRAITMRTIIVRSASNLPEQDKLIRALKWKFTKKNLLVEASL